MAWIKYPKLDTLWMRRETRPKGLIVPGEYANPVFPNIRNWRVTEKVDGTNVRVIYRQQPTHGEPIRDVVITGRTDDAQMPVPLLNYLKDTFTDELMLDNFGRGDRLPYMVMLCGEGYGNKINKAGKRYRDDVSFILFDVYIDGWWLTMPNVRDVAGKLGVDVVPDLGMMTIDEIVEFVQGEPVSRISGIADPTLSMEGIVAEAEPMLYTRNPDNPSPVKFKLKCRDYRQLEAKKHLIEE